MGRKPNTQLDFWNRVKMGKSVLEDCWEWTAGTNYFGYGRFSFEGKLYPAHRLAWIFLKGEVPEELFVLHKCDNRCCCNPWHLFLGTQQDNIDDMMQKNRSRIKKIRRLTDNEVIAIRAMHDAKVELSVISECFDASIRNICNIVAGETHKDLL